MGYRDGSMGKVLAVNLDPQHTHKYWTWIPSTHKYGLVTPELVSGNR